MVNRAPRSKFNSQSRINAAQDFAQAAMQQNFSGGFNSGFGHEPQFINGGYQGIPQQMRQQRPQRIPQMPRQMPPSMPRQMCPPSPQQMGYQIPPQATQMPQQRPQQIRYPMPQQMQPPVSPQVPKQIPRQVRTSIPQPMPQEIHQPSIQHEIRQNTPAEDTGFDNMVDASQVSVPTPNFSNVQEFQPEVLYEVPQSMPEKTVEKPKKTKAAKPKVKKEKKPTGNFARLLRVLLWTILIVFTLLEAYWCLQYFVKGDKIPMTFGHGFVVENSGTMSPNIKSMDLCFLEQKQSYKIDSVIAYVDYDENPCVHRFLGIDTNGMYRAKGDASSLSDKPFEGDRIRGEVVFVLPFGGFLYNPLSKVAFGVILIVLLVVCYRWKAKRSI